MGIEEVSVPSTPLCCEPRTALKIKSVLKKKNIGGNEKFTFGWGRTCGLFDFYSSDWELGGELSGM